MKYAFALVALATAVPTAASAATIIDGSFEAQGAASPGSYCYFGGGYGTSPCATTAWTGGGQTAGLQNEANTAWPGQATPSGSYYAFIQSGYGTPGSISQSLTLAGGSYNFSWLAAGRPGSAGNQAYDVTLSGANGVLSLASGAVTTGQAFTAVSSGPVSVAGGTYTLTFAAQNSGGDNSAFIDNVSVASVPEPATWAMMLVGFGGIGGAMRRRKRKVALRVAYA